MNKVVEVQNGIVSINAGMVGMSFFMTKDGKIKEDPRSRIRLDGARINDQSLWVGPADYRRAYKQAAAILRGRQKRAGRE